MKRVDLTDIAVDREKLGDLLADIADLEERNHDLLAAVAAEAGVKLPHDPEDMRDLFDVRRRLLGQLFG